MSKPGMFGFESTRSGVIWAVSLVVGILAAGLTVLLFAGRPSHDLVVRLGLVGTVTFVYLIVRRYFVSRHRAAADKKRSSTPGV